MFCVVCTCVEYTLTQIKIIVDSEENSVKLRDVMFMMNVDVV